MNPNPVVFTTGSRTGKTKNTEMPDIKSVSVLFLSLQPLRDKQAAFISCFLSGESCFVF